MIMLRETVIVCQCRQYCTKLSRYDFLLMMNFPQLNPKKRLACRGCEVLHINKSDTSQALIAFHAFTFLADLNARLVVAENDAQSKCKLADPVIPR